MNSDDNYINSEIIRSFTPYYFASCGLIVLLCAIVNSEKLVGDRFAYTVGVASALVASGAGGFSPQTRQQSETRVNHADQIEIDQRK